MKHTLIVLAFPLLIATGFAQNTNLSKSTKQEKAAEQVKARYTCPMHPEITSRKAGKCSKCGMNLVLGQDKKETPERQEMSAGASVKERIEKAKSLLTVAKKELAENGKYSCCIKDPCDRCVLDHQSCDCAEDAKAGRAVCPDCYAGWKRGDGIVKGVDPKKVNIESHSHNH